MSFFVCLFVLGRRGLFWLAPYLLKPNSRQGHGSAVLWQLMNAPGSVSGCYFRGFCCCWVFIASLAISVFLFFFFFAICVESEPSSLSYGASENFKFVFVSLETLLNDRENSFENSLVRIFKLLGKCAGTAV